MTLLHVIGHGEAGVARGYLPPPPPSDPVCDVITVEESQEVEMEECTTIDQEQCNTGD